MISLEQIRSLEERVHTAVSRIRALSAENVTLKERLESYEKRISELETLISAFKSDQEEIEAGIIAALRHLDELEDTVSDPVRNAGETPSEQVDEEPTPEPALESPEANVPPPDEQGHPAEIDTGETQVDDDEDSGPEPELDIF